MATYISNILPSKSINLQSPLYMLYNKNPSYSHLHVFGCLCFPLSPSNTIHKLQPRSTPCVFLGYPSNHRGYKCLDMTRNKIIICRHVLFDESTFPYAKLHTPQSTTYMFLDNDLSPYLINHIMTQDQNNSSVPPSKLNTSPNMAHTTPFPNTLPQTIQPTTPSTPTLNSSLPFPQSNHTLQNNLPLSINLPPKPTQNPSLGVNMAFLNLTKNTTVYSLMSQNPPFLGIQCLHLRNLIGKWPCMMNIML